MARKALDPNARMALNQMKQEIAQELGVSSDIGSMDKSNVTSRANGHLGGSLGGTMTRKLVEMAEKQLIDQNK